MKYKIPKGWRRIRVGEILPRQSEYLILMDNGFLKDSAYVANTVGNRLESKMDGLLGRKWVYIKRK